MRIGVPKEIKDHEHRVGLTPMAVQSLTGHGHKVMIETGAGAGINESDDAYRDAGAMIVSTADAVYADAAMIVKVKEPQSHECKMLRCGQILFTYLHLAADWALAGEIAQSGVTGIAYETVTDANGRLPLLAPMSEVAGRLATQAGAHYLEHANGGRGILLGGVAGVAPAHVVILGGGVAGTQAAKMALGLGARVTMIEKSVDRLRTLSDLFGPGVQLLASNDVLIRDLLPDADLVIGTVLVPGRTAPKLVRRDDLKRMKPGAVMVDVAIDQGGCFETSHPTTHSDPVFTVDGIVHYCVANMPGAVPLTATQALNNATLPFVQALADKGADHAMAEDPHLRAGLNVQGGVIVHPDVLASFDQLPLAAE